MDYSYSYSYSYSGTLPTWVYFLYAIIAIIAIVSWWKIFVKAGRKGRESLIPLYNLVIMFKIAGKSPRAILLFFVPIANIVVLVDWSVKLAKKFGKSGRFGVGILFFPIIFLPILAFGDAEYKVEEKK